MAVRLLLNHSSFPLLSEETLGRLLTLNSVTGSKIQVAGWCMYVSVLWIIKAALCAFYVRLTVSQPLLDTGSK